MTIILQRLRNYTETKLIAILTSIAILVTGIIFLLMRPIELELTTQTVYGIIDLEFAWSVGQTEKILATWGEELISKEINAVLLDFGFLVVYSLSLAGVTFLLTKFGVFGSWANLGYYFTLIPFLAAFLDFVENINLLIVLNFPSSFPSFAPLVASICATIKFGLIIATVLFWIIGLAYSLVKRIFE